MSMAARNRSLKKTLELAFGRGKVTVRGSRGTAYGWATVHISYSPRNVREARELKSKVWQLISAAKIEIGTYGYDDPGSDYGYGSKLMIEFDAYREKADWTGPDSWRQHLSAEDWDQMSKGEAA